MVVNLNGLYKGLLCMGEGGVVPLHKGGKNRGHSLRGLPLAFGSHGGCQ
ncbi:MAG: hypothetical protein RL577_1533 [Bacteroidota bacterium]